MVQTDITYNPGLDLKLLHVCLIEHLIASLRLNRREDSEFVEHLNRLRFNINLVCLRHIADSLEAPACRLFLPFPAVSVPLEHDIGRLGNEFADCGENCTLTALALSLKGVNLSPEIIEAGAAGGEWKVKATCSEKPYIVGQSDWCSVTASPVRDNSCELTVNVAANDSYEARSFQYSVVCGDLKKYLKVNQEAAREDLSFLDTPSLPDNDAISLSRKLGYGWNLGNQMDAVNNGVSGETFWGNEKCTQATFDNLKAKGFSTVRIPVTWMGHIGDAPDYMIESSWLDRVAEIAGYAKQAGLNAIVNIHHDDSPESGWLRVRDAARDEAFKTEMLARYKAGEMDVEIPCIVNSPMRGTGSYSRATMNFRTAAGDLEETSRTEESSIQ